MELSGPPGAVETTANSGARVVLDDHGHENAAGRRAADPIDLTVSIDTEEDSWEPSIESTGARNILELPRLAAFFAGLGVRATYFVTYQVASDPRAAGILRELGTDGAEIGAHLHPWNTPPYCGLESRVTMLKNYPEAAQYDKIRRLLETIESNIGVRPVSFRAGRFGIGPSTTSALLRAGLLIDSSVTPFLTWKPFDDGPSFITAPTRIYRVSAGEDVCRPCDSGSLSEVPISVGYTRFGPAVWPMLTRTFGRRSLRRLRLGGLAARTGLLRRVILSPEVSTTDDMVRMSCRMIAGKASHFHMFFHSNSLVPGLTPFVKSPEEVERLYRRIEQYVVRMNALRPVRYRTVREAARTLAPGDATREV